MKKSLEKRIRALEKGYSVPGTIIQRVLHPASGVRWTIGFGGMQGCKMWFDGDTLKECIYKAERGIIP